MNIFMTRQPIHVTKDKPDKPYNPVYKNSQESSCLLMEYTRWYAVIWVSRTYVMREWNISSFLSYITSYKDSFRSCMLVLDGHHMTGTRNAGRVTQRVPSCVNYMYIPWITIPKPSEVIIKTCLYNVRIPR